MPGKESVTAEKWMMKTSFRKITSTVLAKVILTGPKADKYYTGSQDEFKYQNSGT